MYAHERWGMAPLFGAANPVLEICGVERTERSGVNDRGPTSLHGLQLPPLAPRPERKRLPGAEGLPEEENGPRGLPSDAPLGGGAQCIKAQGSF